MSRLIGTCTLRSVILLFVGMTNLSSLFSVDSSSYTHLLSGSSPLMTSKCQASTDYDPFSFLAGILDSPPEPVLPVWEVQLLLKERSKTKHKQNISFEVILAPSLVEFQDAIEKMLALYEEVITSFVPISKDPRLTVFTTASRFDLLMRIEEEKNIENSDARPRGFSWPNVNMLLHEYDPYKDSVTFIRNVLSGTVNEIYRLSKVSIQHMLEYWKLISAIVYTNNVFPSTFILKAISIML